MKSVKKKLKNMSKKCFSLMLVALMVIVQFPVTAFAETATTEDEIDAIIREGIKASNEAMAKGGSYAVLSELGEDNTVTVYMYDGNYAIKGSGTTGVYYDIIGVLVNKLYENRTKVEKIEAVNNPNNGGTIKLEELQGQTAQDSGKIVSFIKELGLKKSDGQPLSATEGIGQLNGQNFSVKVYGKGSSNPVTYTVKFESVSITVEDIDAIIRDGIVASNSAMVKNGVAYAELSDLEVINETSRSVTVNMYNPDYAIKGSQGENVYDDIITVLVDKLYQNRAKVTKIKADASEEPQATITLNTLTGTKETDAGTISGFVVKLGLKGKDGNLNPAEGIGQLDGQSFSVTVTANNNVTATYKVNFKIFKELVLTDDASNENDSNLKLEVTEDSKVLTGKDLVDTTKAAGNTVDAVKAKFEDAASGYTIKIVDKKNNELQGTDPVGTGSKIELLDSDNKVVDTVTIIVMGDVDGDGGINVADATNMLNNISKISKLSGVYEQASHVTGDPTLSVADVVKVLNTITSAQNK